MAFTLIMYSEGNTAIAFHLVIQETNFKQCISDAVRGTPSSLEI